MAIRAVVLGASGFGGGELLRILAGHPAIDVVAAGASSQAGKPVSDLYPSSGSGPETLLTNEQALGVSADVVFCSLPHGKSSRLLSDFGGAKVIDLAGDFRLTDRVLHRAWYGHEDQAASDRRGWVYGLTEFHREDILDAAKVANPGCYAAACILALAPLLEAGLIEPEGIHISAMSGISGAGRGSGGGFDFSSVNENARPYKPTGHNHIPEIEQELAQFATRGVRVSFVPHLVPMTRGILVSATAGGRGAPSAQDLTRALSARYETEPFVRVLDGDELPQTKRLSGTNFAEVAATTDGRTGRVLAFAAIDNLGKGAAGQAVQNANLMLGLAETTGLSATGLAP